VGRRPPTESDLARRHELLVRFQQTCGPVMAKGVEDTAFYRWHRLAALNEVGGDPTHVGVSPEEFHAYAARVQHDWPATMTTLSTHDTKRSEDVRARLATLAELPVEWAEAVRGWTLAATRHRSPRGWPDRATAYLIWQTLVGTWDGAPLPAPRLLAYLEKATREAKLVTSWASPDTAYEAAVRAYATAVLGDGDLVDSLARFCATIEEPARVAVLGQKLVQLAMPGVPDVYQGCESLALSVVDPDNRRAVDFDDRRRRLARLDSGERPKDLSDEKLLVTSTCLRLRREHPGWFVGPGATYAPVATTTGNALALARGDATGPAVVAVATRLPVALARRGGWGEHTLVLPGTAWRDALTGRRAGAARPVRLADLLADLPVALLVREP
jgi:(1->4)-alpha-D-glucan 1-alpha-D-glucosylmutase